MNPLTVSYWQSEVDGHERERAFRVEERLKSSIMVFPVLK